MVHAPPCALALAPSGDRRYLDVRHTGMQIPQAPLVKITGRDVHLSCFKRSDDGRGWVVRIYSLARKRQRCTISAAVPLRSARLCDLAERAGTRLKRSGEGFSFSIRPKEITTVLLEIEGRELRRAQRSRRPQRS